MTGTRWDMLPNVNSTTLSFPGGYGTKTTSASASQVQNWTYGLIKRFYVESRMLLPPGTILIRDAADTKTLWQINMDMVGATVAEAEFAIDFPVFEPWGAKLAANDGSFALVYETGGRDISTEPHRGRLSRVGPITAATMVYPNGNGGTTATSSLSSVQSWNYGIIRCVTIQTHPLNDVELMIRDAADTKTLARFHIDNSNGYISGLHVDTPIFEPWGIKLSAADGTCWISYEHVGYNS